MAGWSFQAITQRDLIVVESVVMLLVAFVIIVNLLVDLSYPLVDPRLRHADVSSVEQPDTPARLSDFARTSLANRSFVTGLAIALAIVLMALVSFFWTPYDVTHLVVSPTGCSRPRGSHWFGTDHFGRDILSMIMVGSRNSIAVALVAVGIGMGLGVPLGCWAAARRGYMDEAIMRLQRHRLRVSRPAVGDHDHRDLRPWRRQRHHRHRHLQHSGLRPRCPRRRAVAMAARIHPGRARLRQGQER